MGTKNEAEYRPLVCIQKSWEETDLLRQTPNHSGIWSGIEYTEEPVDECDYLIIINQPSRPLQITCPPEHVWALMQEPPNEVFRRLHRKRSDYARVYTTDPNRSGNGYLHSQPAIPWHVKRSYDWLSRIEPPEKSQPLSWITSSRRSFRGHKERMAFLNRLQATLDFDLYGRGFAEIDDKWDALASYRYSLAIENYVNEFYWTEKIADCFLAWTMPIYYGCTEINQYFPSESFLPIDIHDPDVADHIAEIIQSDAWIVNRAAIAEARQLVLEKYQFFPMFSGLIQALESQYRTVGQRPEPRRISIPIQPPWIRVESRLLNNVYRVRKLVNPDL